MSAKSEVTRLSIEIGEMHHIITRSVCVPCFIARPFQQRLTVFMSETLSSAPADLAFAALACVFFPPPLDCVVAVSASDSSDEEM